MVTINSSHEVKLRRISDEGTIALRSALRDVGGWEEEAIRMSPTGLRKFAVSRIVSNIKDNNGIFPEDIVIGLEKTRKRLLHMDNWQIADNYIRVVDMVNSHKVHVRLLYDGISRPEISVHEKVRGLEELSKVAYSHLADMLLPRNSQDRLLAMKRGD